MSGIRIALLQFSSDHLQTGPQSCGRIKASIALDVPRTWIYHSCVRDPSAARRTKGRGKARGHIQMDPGIPGHAVGVLAMPGPSGWHPVPSQHMIRPLAGPWAGFMADIRMVLVITAAPALAASCLEAPRKTTGHRQEKGWLAARLS